MITHTEWQNVQSGNRAKRSEDDLACARNRDNCKKSDIDERCGSGNVVVDIFVDQALDVHVPFLGSGSVDWSCLGL